MRRWQPRRVSSHRLEFRLADLSGARILRVTDGHGAVVAEHAHDWPVLSIFISGGYHNVCDLGQADISRPSAIFYQAGQAHANRISGDGLEQIDIEFDPRWLGADLQSRLPSVRRWIGGRVGRQARELALSSALGRPEAWIAEAARRFFALALGAEVPASQPWIEQAFAALSGARPPSTPSLARSFGLSPAWMAQAYHAAVGEGVRETVRRRRVERAMRMLRETRTAYCDVAQDAGFCDQSHMIRAFRQVIGRTPSSVRGDFEVGSRIAA